MATSQSSEDQDGQLTWEPSEVLVLPVRVQAASQEQSRQLTRELEVCLLEMPDWLGVQRGPADPGSQDADVLLVTVSNALAFPGLLSVLVGFKHRHDVTVSLADRQGSSPGTQADAAAPRLAELLSRMQLLSLRLEAIKQDSVAMGIEEAEDLEFPSPPVEPLTEADVEQVQLSATQRQALERMLEPPERMAQDYDQARAQARATLKEVAEVQQQGLEALRRITQTGDDLSRRGHPDSAFEVYQLALSLAETYLESDPAGTVWQHELAQVSWRLGTLEVPANPKRQRRRHLTRALQVLVKLEREEPLTGEEQELPRKIREALQALH